jgi:cation transport ATPase
MSAHETIYRFLLRAYPDEFRSAYGREMEQLFRDQRRDAADSAVRLWAETVWDVVRSAPALRIEGARARWNHIHTRESNMKTMAILAMLTGIVLAASALIEGWAGGIGNHDGLSLTAGILGLLAGALLFAAGIGLLRQSSRAAMRANVGAITCLAAFALITVAAPRMSVLTTILGIGFPIALLFFLRWTRGRGSSASPIARV